MNPSTSLSLNSRRSRVNAVSDENNQSEATAKNETEISFPSKISNRSNELLPPKDVQTQNGAHKPKQLDEVDTIVEKRAIGSYTNPDKVPAKDLTVNESLSDRHARLREKERSILGGSVRRRNEFKEKIMSHLTDHCSGELPKRVIQLVDQHISNDFIDLVPPKVESNFLSRLTRRDAIIGEKSLQRELEILNFLKKYLDESSKQKEVQGDSLSILSHDTISIQSVDSGYMTTNEQIPAFGIPMFLINSNS